MNQPNFMGNKIILYLVGIFGEKINTTLYSFGQEARQRSGFTKRRRLNRRVALFDKLMRQEPINSHDRFGDDDPPPRVEPVLMRELGS